MFNDMTNEKCKVCGCNLLCIETDIMRCNSCVEDYARAEDEAQGMTFEEFNQTKWD